MDILNFKRGKKAVGTLTAKREESLEGSRYADLGPQESEKTPEVSEETIAEFVKRMLAEHVKGVSFSVALFLLKDGKKVQRSGWNGKGMYLRYFDPVAHGMERLTVEGENKPLLPFILMKTADDMWVPWLASQTDILAEDWKLVE